MWLSDLLTHHGILTYGDYFTVFTANIITILLQGYDAQVKHPTTFKFKVLYEENYFRWILTFATSLFLLYVVPEGYLWYMVSIMNRDIDTIYWNTLFSAAIGLSPLYFLKKLIKISKSKFRDEVENK
jgi:hypothetical protein